MTADLETDDQEDRPWESFEDDVGSVISDLTVRPAREHEVEILEVEPLTYEDLIAARQAGGLPAVSQPPVKRLRQIHHRIAMMLGTGHGIVETSAATGFSVSRIEVLRADPAFAQLEAHYAHVGQQEHMDLVRRFGDFAGDALSELHERLDEQPEQFSPSVLLEALKATSDRAGFGPTSTSRTFNLSARLSSEEAAQLREEAKGREDERIHRGDPRAARGSQPLALPSGSPPRSDRPPLRTVEPDSLVPAEKWEGVEPLPPRKEL